MSEAARLADLIVGRFFLCYPDGSPVGLDSGSGGYPFKASSPTCVKFWSSERYARSYQKIMKNENLQLHQVIGIDTDKVTA